MIKELKLCDIMHRAITVMDERDIDVKIIKNQLHVPFTKVKGLCYVLMVYYKLYTMLWCNASEIYLN